MKRINFVMIHILYSFTLLTLSLLFSKNLGVLNKIGTGVFIFLFSMLCRYIFPMTTSQYSILGSVKTRDKSRFVDLLEVFKIISLVFFSITLLIALLSLVYIIVMQEKPNFTITIWMVLPVWISVFIGAKESINLLRSNCDNMD